MIVASRQLMQGFGSSQRRAVLLVCALLLACVAAHAQVPVPELRARVTDLTATFSADQSQALDEQLAALEQRKGAQIAVLVIATLAPRDAAPEAIESFATRVFDAWKLGRKGIDDGVLLLVVKDDRKVRIEVGYGLEGTIPDVAAARIIREYVTPKFRGGDYYGAVHDAIGALAELIDGGQLPAPLEGPRAALADSSSQGSSTLGMLVAAIFAGLMLGFLLACILRSVFTIFPARVIPVVARRVAGLVAGPLIIAAVYIWATHAGSDAAGALPLAPLLLAAAITAWLGWSIAANGASNKWFGGMTWGDLLGALFQMTIGVLLSVVFEGLFGSVAGRSGSRGFSGGGGRSGGGGASGSW